MQKQHHVTDWEHPTLNHGQEYIHYRANIWVNDDLNKDTCFVMGIDQEQVIVPNEIIITKKFDITDFIFRASWFCENACDGHQ